MQESTPALKAMTPLYATEIHMLEGLKDEELERYLGENPRIVRLFEIVVGRTMETYASLGANAAHDVEPSEEAIAELHRTQDAFEREM